MAPSFRHPPAITHSLLLTLIVSIMLLIAGCSNGSQEIETEAKGVQVELIEPLFPPAIGNETLNIRVFDAHNQPVNHAKINLHGNPPDANIVPIIAKTQEGNVGLYQVPIEWTISGDWIVTVQVNLPDGMIVEKTFPRTIANEAADCEHEDKNRP